MILPQTIDSPAQLIEFVRVLRHELDHVAQIKLLISCNGNSTFSTHSRRERAAYFNDSYYANSFNNINTSIWSLERSTSYSNNAND